MKTILLIEDNDMMRENTKEILELSDYHVLSAENGRLGLEMALDRNPDLIICDVMMPEMSGTEVLNNLKNSGTMQDTPFIFLSAYDDKASIMKITPPWEFEFIAKPFNGDELLRAIGKCLKKRPGSL